jgi:hypothetical protein
MRSFIYALAGTLVGGAILGGAALLVGGVLVVGGAAVVGGGVVYMNQPEQVLQPARFRAVEKQQAAAPVPAAPVPVQTNTYVAPAPVYSAAAAPTYAPTYAQPTHVPTPTYAAPTHPPAHVAPTGMWGAVAKVVQAPRAAQAPKRNGGSFSSTSSSSNTSSDSSRNYGEVRTAGPGISTVQGYDDTTTRGQNNSKTQSFNQDW